MKPPETVAAIAGPISEITGPRCGTNWKTAASTAHTGAHGTPIISNPINHNPAILLRTQDLPPVYEENSCLYLFTRQTLETRRNRLGERPFMFEMDAAEAWDIDEEMDFLVADLLLSHRLKSLV